jgi:hypothetical protein
MPSSTIFMPMYLREVEELHAKEKKTLKMKLFNCICRCLSLESECPCPSLERG